MAGPLLDALSRWPGERAQIYVVPSPYEILIGRRGHLRLHDIPLIEVMHDEPIAGGTLSKRAFDADARDVAASSVALPVMIARRARAMPSRLGAPVIFRQSARRDGRAAVHDAQVPHHASRGRARRPGPVLASENDPRVTALGRAPARDAPRRAAAALERAARRHELRRAAARAARVRAQFEQEIQGYRERFKVRPGLTGYAQVNGEYHTSATTKLKYDLAYMYNRSFWLDLKILSETAKVMLTRRGV